METQTKPLSFWERANDWVRRSVTLKLFTVGFLTLALLIPTAFVRELIREREQTRDEAVREVSSSWGAAQTVGGPVLTVPYRRTETDEKGKVLETTAYAHFLPASLTVVGTVTPEQRPRGIYVVMLYRAGLKLSGTFERPDFSKFDVPESAILWQDAFVSMGVTDLRGIQEAVGLTWNGRPVTSNPGTISDDIFASGVHAPVPLDPAATAPTIPFTATLQLNGSSELAFLPFGRETRVALTSTWGTPSFNGAFLPDKRTVTPDGFSAEWKVLHFNRNYPQAGLGAFIPRFGKPQNGVVAGETPADQTGAFGVKLLLPVDEYQKTTRSAKYAALFIVLTFTAFFFIEILNRRRLHPIQYLLVGFAVCLFYVLLLSISEHLSFRWAYLIGCLTILSLVFFYTKSIFQNGRITLIFNGILALLYAFFYSLLQLADYSLLLGSLGLVLILGVVMYLTRRVDWYNAYGRAEATTANP